MCSLGCGLEEGLSRGLIVCFEGQREESKEFWCPSYRDCDSDLDPGAA